MKKQLVSFVIPCYRSAETIGSVVDEIEAAMGELERYEYEIILVNDCSPDDTFGKIRELCGKDKRIKGINLARNFGQHAALMAGFHQVKGDIWFVWMMTVRRLQTKSASFWLRWKTAQTLHMQNMSTSITAHFGISEAGSTTGCSALC